jgi:WD40 repeat protein
LNRDNSLLTIVDELRAKIWALNEAKVIRTIDHPEKITECVFTHDSHYVITGGEDNSCKIWELSSGKLIQVSSL